MTVLQKTISNFAQGEISLEVQGRVDISGTGKIYDTSLAYQRNAINTEQGPSKRRTGLRFMNETKGFGSGRNIPFVFNDTQAYGLSFSDRYLRFIKNRQLIESGGNPYEIKSPYAAADLPYVQYTQNADVVYLTCPGYAPRKLTRLSDTSWTLKTFKRTSDPFCEAAKSISGITKASQCVVTATGHGYSNGDEVDFHDIGGMVELNDDTYIVSDKDANTFKIKDLAGNYINSSAYTTYTSGGGSYKVKKNEQPVAVAFDTGRLWYGGSTTYPDKYWGSKGPQDDGTPRYDDFSVSSPLVASDAVIQVLPSSRGKVDVIRWISSTKEFLVIGTFSTVYKVTGETAADPIDPTKAIAVKPLSDQGCLDASPDFMSETLFYIQRNALKVRSLQYSVMQDSYGTEDRNLIANRVTGVGVSSIVAQAGRPDILWGVRGDGKFVGLSYKGPDDVIEGWHRHDTPGEVVDIMALPRNDGYDELYFIVKRTIENVDKHYIEYLADDVLYPTLEDFIGDSLDADAAKTAYENYVWEINKDAVFLDSAITYDGSEQTVNLTFAENVDGTVTVTASDSVFSSAHVGREIWLKYDELGNGGGRLVITGYTSATAVTCSIRQALPDYSITALAGNWYLTASTVSGLTHLEGKEVRIVIDGALHKTATVVDGAVSLDAATQGSKIHVGLNYISIIKTNNLNPVTTSGNNYTSNKNVNRIDVDVLETGVFKIGTRLDKLETVLTGDKKISGRVSLPKTGVREVPMRDESSKDKHIYVVQDAPYPLTLRGLTIYVDTNI